MRVGYHPAVQRDVNRMLRHYDWISPELGDRFALLSAATAVRDEEIVESRIEHIVEPHESSKS